MTVDMLRAKAQILLQDARRFGERMECSDGDGVCSLAGILVLIEKAEEFLAAALVAERGSKV